METFSIKDNKDSQFAFEIENIYLSLNKVGKLLSTLEGIKINKIRKPFEASEYLIEFDYKGRLYEVWEPFGDSSRYWIGPKKGAEEMGNNEIKEIEDVFKQYEINPFVKLIGDLLSLKIFSRKKN